jgi:hypothetical protein
LFCFLTPGTRMDSSTDSSLVELNPDSTASYSRGCL